MNELKTILVVDDEIVIRTLFERMLKGYTVMTVSSGEEAMEYVSQKRTDLVLLDLNMPGIGGIETLKRIKEFNKDIVVFVITAFGTSETKEKAMNLGASVFLSKPFDMQFLMTRVKEALA